MEIIRRGRVFKGSGGSDGLSSEMILSVMKAKIDGGTNTYSQHTLRHSHLIPRNISAVTHTSLALKPAVMEINSSI